MQVSTLARKSRKTRIIEVREPSGRPSRAGEEKEFAPTAVRRLRDAALKGMADAEWGSVAGQLFLARKIDAPAYAAAKRWAEKAARYHDAIGAPPPNPRALDFEGGRGGSSPDPDSDEGQRRATKDMNAVTDFLVAHSVLVAAGVLAEMIVRDVCERNILPVGQEALLALNRGLLWLATHWGLTNEGKSRHGR